MTADVFRQEIKGALQSYDKYVICVQKTPDEFEATLNSLVMKAIKAYENRATGLRHGIALDKFVTVILSQTEQDRPMCGIYFNLHSPYLQQPPTTGNKRRERETIGGAAEI